MTESAAATALDPLTLPLAGSRLIEASAGTGKTWTIAALVLRLVLGHGTPARSVDQILVMTFTRAATRELADRIRARLAQAAAVFRGEVGPGDDALLQGLLAAFPEGDARTQAAWRLAMAADAMDDAAVHTIDAWCQRMLREHAFDSGSLFDEELQADEAALRDAAVRDVWRQQVYPLQGDALAAVLGRWPSPAALAQAIRPLWDGELPAGGATGTLADAVDRALAGMQALKAGWAERADAMLAWLRVQWARKDCPFNKVRLGEKHTPVWLQTLKDWARSPGLDGPGLSDAARLRLTDAGARDALKAGCTVDLPPEFAAFADLMAALQAQPDPTNALRVHAAALARERLAQLKAAAGTFGFADLLQRLDDALDDARHGERALRLRERIVAQYPVALIDEFQDTSPVQLSVFDRLYCIEKDDPATTLLLIGDPKQAIYAFRGADIQSYLRARRATAGRHHVLDTNHRSATALVDAVNTLFQRAETRPGAGAFGFGAALPFEPVRARGRPERLVDATGPLPAVTWVADATPRLAAEHQPLFAALAAERIVALLDDPKAGFLHGDGGFQRLRPADIAVLVRTGREAQTVREALRRRGLASVYLSDRDSVFATPEAADLLRLLQAVAAPRDTRLARAALATALLARTLPELRALADDDARFDRAAETLQALQPVWRQQGVLAMLRRALHAFDLPARWLAAEDVAGERRLTNVLHLAELLQAAAGTLEGEPALIRWLAQQIDGDETGGDDRVLRLESDADLVQVVTIHKSKGLEYPLVFLPFVAQCRPRDGREQLLWAPLPDGGRRLLTDPSPDDWAQADADRLREDLRLLYVALTRARHALWVGMAAAATGKARTPLWPRSAAGQLLCGPGAEAFGPALDALASPAVGVQWLPPAETPPLPPVTRRRAQDADAPLAPAPRYSASFDRDWAIASYSALVRDAGRGVVAGLAPDTPAVPLLREDEPVEADAVPRGADQPWHRFPRGAFAGNFLHDQLEWLAGEGFALDGSADLRQTLLRRCERQGWGHRADDVLAWLQQVCATPLPPLGVPLCGLETVWPEMEFWLPSNGLDAGRIDALCRAHLWPDAPRPALPPRRLRGLLMGFADLVIEHGGRYWVLDHKSNALGGRDADYTADALQAAMCEHRYDVQAALYLLALHRLLRARLGAAYVPARHLGGGIYLFLRGVQGSAAGCCTVAAPVALVQALDALITPVEAAS
ncbi:MAG: exodeoxyribonuclease V subunit beta [Burkholderiaceae bacterium]|nr:exodeoxyribonuclease V subunit beta [Burkholderiaceae bacterium]